MNIDNDRFAEQKKLLATVAQADPNSMIEVTIKGSQKSVSDFLRAGFDAESEDEERPATNIKTMRER